MFRHIFWKESDLMNNFKYSNTNKRYHTLDYYYKNKFNEKVFKVSLNAGFSCPNIDGTVGFGGCIYCSKLGSGDFAGDVLKPLTEQFNSVRDIILKKWPNSKYIGYFQANTNTYAPLSVLKEKYENYSENLYKIELTGYVSPDSNLNLVEISARLSQSLYFVKLKDLTELKADLESLAKEASLKGIFVKNMLAKMESAEDKETYKKALNLGLKAFFKEVKYNED